ncbi:MAG: hypothetical protein ACRECA_09200 [Pseudolabrys sp.]
MTAEHKKRFRVRRQAPNKFERLAFAAFCFALLWPGPIELAAQQSVNVIYTPGNAAVTGFSGASSPIQIAPGDNPNQKTFIDLNGPSLRIIDLQHMRGPPRAQLIAAPKPLTVRAALVGQVFGVALDDNSPSNIYAAATSAYGLPIVAPGPGGQPQHIKVGAPNAAFMPGLWGPGGGGPGSIWKIDGATGKVSLFANVTDNGRNNSGASLGGLAYDPASESLFVADRETGFIHHFGMDGRDLGRYDHGVTGRTAQGLTPVSWDSPPPLNIASPQFDSQESTTWNYTVPERRVFGLAVHEHRLYYAVADGLQIWSIGLKSDGSFDNDAIIELVVPPSSGPTEISKITFDEQGRMFLAERAIPTGAFDFKALAVPAIGRVLRYSVAGTVASGRRIWQQQPDDYAIGFPASSRNGNGGIAIGYNYDGNGEIVLGSCGGFMWATGEDLRHSPDATLAARLGQSGALSVSGLQGNGTWRVRHNDELPLLSYFINYDDEFQDESSRGHMGDIAIERLCTPAQHAGLVPPGGVPPQAGNPPGQPSNPPNIPGPPPSSCPPDQVRRASTGICGNCSRPNVQIGGRCCTLAELATGGACSNSSCQPGQTAIGPSNFCCSNTQVYKTASGTPACCASTLVNGTCPTPTPPPSNCTPSPTNPQCCPSGYVSTGASCCLASKLTSTGTCCPAGQAPSGSNNSECKPIVLVPIGPRCCASGLIPTGNGQCCASANVTTSGVCCSGPVDPKNRTSCPAQIQKFTKCAVGYTTMPDGTCCNNRFVNDDGKSCRTVPSSVPLVPLVPRACPPGTMRGRDGSCMQRQRPGCAPGLIRLRNGECVRRGRLPCPPGMIRTPRGFCIRFGPLRRFGGPRRFGPPAGGPRLLR